MTEPTNDLHTEEGLTLKQGLPVEIGDEKDATPSSLRSELETLRLQLSKLQHQAKEMKKSVASRRAEFESLGRELKMAQKKKSHTTLTLLRERDTALERVQILERQLTLFKEEAGLPSVRARKHAHFLERLAVRCGLTLKLEDVGALETLARGRPALHFTRRGTPVKALPINGQWVYALMTPDEEGRSTLTTVYSADMLEVRDFFQTTARPQKIH